MENKQQNTEQKEVNLDLSFKEMEGEVKELEKKGEELVEKVEGSTRKIKGPVGICISILAIVFTIFEIYANGPGLIQSIKHGGIFLAFILALIFLLYPPTNKSSKQKVWWFDYVLAALGVFCGLYIVFAFGPFYARFMVPTTFDLIVGALAILLTLEATRRTCGIWLVIIPVAFLLYAIFGNYIPGALGHSGFSVPRIIVRMYFVEEGLFGSTQRVAATYIFMFILFGAFLGLSGVGKFINDLAFALSGKSVGGPAKIAVIASGIMGTVSGSAAGNVATTGAFTIPLMKRTGFSPAMAGAVEATASTGGQIMPPIMGSAAFLMAEFLGVPYSEIMLAAIIPALLYYLSVYFVVHLEASRLGLRGLPKEMLPQWREVLSRSHLIIPLIVVVWVLLSGRTPLSAAFMAIGSTILVSWIRKDTRMGYKEILSAMESGAKGALGVAIACTVAGLIIGVMTITGLGQVVTYNMLKLSHGYLFMALVLTAVGCIVLSMGLPSAAAYVVVATVAAPAIIQMDVAPMAAHMFVMYFATLSNITPPVALAAYTAAGLSGANPTEVAWKAMRLALAAFIVPFMCVYAPQLVLVDYQVPAIFLNILTACLGVFALSLGTSAFSLFNKVSIIERVLFIISALSLIDPSLLTDIIGISALVVGILLNKYTHSKQATENHSQKV
jgi:TRAP transporter 4TM/12TM fusion protein